MRIRSIPWWDRPGQRALVHLRAIDVRILQVNEEDARQRAFAIKVRESSLNDVKASRLSPTPGSYYKEQEAKTAQDVVARRAAGKGLPMGSYIKWLSTRSHHEGR